MDEVLAHLIPSAFVGQKLRHVRPVDGPSGSAGHGVFGGLITVAFVDVVAHRAEERLFEAAAHAEQRRIPFSGPVYSGEAAVVQFF